MKRGRLGVTVASTMFVISLHGEISAAAEPGFYVGAAGGRSEQRLDRQAGVGPVVISVLPPPGNLPPVFGTLPGLIPRDPIAGLPIYLNPSASFVPLLPAGSAVDETDVGWNFALGYRVNKYVAAELTYVDAGEASLTERFSTGPSAPGFPDVVRTYTVNSRGPTVSVLGSLPLSEKWEVFLRGGVFFAQQDVESRMIIDSPNATSGRPIERDYSDEVYNVGAGVQWAFLPRWTARLEYQRSDNLQANDIMGKSRLDQATLSVLFGL